MGVLRSSHHLPRTCRPSTWRKLFPCSLGTGTATRGGRNTTPGELCSAALHTAAVCAGALGKASRSLRNLARRMCCVEAPQLMVKPQHTVCWAEKGWDAATLGCNYSPGPCWRHQGSVRSQGELGKASGRQRLHLWCSHRMTASGGPRWGTGTWLTLRGLTMMPWDAVPLGKPLCSPWLPPSGAGSGRRCIHLCQGSAGAELC